MNAYFYGTDIEINQFDIVLGSETDLNKLYIIRRHNYMYRVKIKQSADDLQFIKDCGLNTTTVYTTYRKDNGCYEICGFEFEKNELEFLD